MRTWIKICATTNLEDALASVEAGADALGFVFAESLRRVSARSIRSIAAELPSRVEKIGVFVNQSPAFLARIAEQAGLTGIQLQGEENPDYLRELKKQLEKLRGPVAITKTVAFSDSFEVDLKNYAKEDRVDRLLIDAGSATQRGGTGKVFDWQAAAQILKRVPHKKPIIIAGGLNPTNVAEAIAIFCPWGVDVVSGVEAKPGRKDHAKLREFVTNARRALAEMAREGR